MLSQDPMVKINRVDIPFPRTLAASVSKVIKTMIEHAKEETSTDRVILHGTHILFMIDDPEGRTLQARLAPESRGRNASALRNFIKSLDAYCKAAPEDRLTLRRKIEAEVRKLSSQNESIWRRK
jgi:hypothetical protein